MITKNNFIPFLIGLLVGVLIIGLVFFNTDRFENGTSASTTRAAANSPLKEGWEATFGKLNFESIKDFIAKENIKIVAFINDKDGFLISTSQGTEITGWCTMNGTEVGSECSWIKDGSKLAYFNQVAIFSTVASPDYVWINVGGTLTCYDTSTGRKCGQ